MRAILDQARPQMRALHDQLLDNRKQLPALMQGTLDERQLRTLADARGKTIADLIVLRTNVHLKIGKVLTEQQREQLHQLRGGRGQAPRDDYGPSSAITRIGDQCSSSLKSSGLERLANILCSGEHA